jgi:hypothetical protein
MTPAELRYRVIRDAMERAGRRRLEPVAPLTWDLRSPPRRFELPRLRVQMSDPALRRPAEPEAAAAPEGLTC